MCIASENTCHICVGNAYVLSGEICYVQKFHRYRSWATSRNIKWMYSHLHVSLIWPVLHQDCISVTIKFPLMIKFYLHNIHMFTTKFSKSNMYAYIKQYHYCIIWYFPCFRFTYPGIFQIAPQGVPSRGSKMAIVTRRVMSANVDLMLEIVMVKLSTFFLEVLKFYNSMWFVTNTTTMQTFQHQLTIAVLWFIGFCRTMISRFGQYPKCFGIISHESIFSHWKVFCILSTRFFQQFFTMATKYHI